MVSSHPKERRNSIRKRACKLLVLSRKAVSDQDEIVIDNKKIVFKILSVKGGVVRIGISAESSINIARGEIYVEHQEKGREAKP